MLNGPYHICSRSGSSTPWVPGSDVEVALAQIGKSNQTGFSFHWDANFLAADAWKVYISNDPSVWVRTPTWELQNWDYTAFGVLGCWHEITPELIPAPAVPGGGALDHGWINVANAHTAFVRLALTINIGQVPAFGLLNIWFNAVGW
jgi:hypothetical protein